MFLGSTSCKMMIKLTGGVWNQHHSLGVTLFLLNNLYYTDTYALLYYTATYKNVDTGAPDQQPSLTIFTSDESY